MTSDGPATRARWLIGGLAALLLIAAGVITGLLLNRPTVADIKLPDGSSLVDYAASQAALPRCADVFVPGQKIDIGKGKAGCKDPQGEIQLGGYDTCVDGRIMFGMDADSGAPEGYGFGGETYTATATERAADAGYGVAYRACRGQKE